MKDDYLRNWNMMTSDMHKQFQVLMDLNIKTLQNLHFFNHEDLSSMQNPGDLLKRHMSLAMENSQKLLDYTHRSFQILESAFLPFLKAVNDNTEQSIKKVKSISLPMQNQIKTATQRVAASSKGTATKKRVTKTSAKSQPAKLEAKKAAPRKAVAKNAAPKNASARKSTSKNVLAKKAAPKNGLVRKTASKSVLARKAVPKSALARKAASKSVLARKAAPKSALARKASSLTKKAAPKRVAKVSAHAKNRISASAGKSSASKSRMKSAASKSMMLNKKKSSSTAKVSRPANQQSKSKANMPMMGRGMSSSRPNSSVAINKSSTERQRGNSDSHMNILNRPLGGHLADSDKGKNPFHK
ncbi:MAG: hypothetical protein H0T84_09890 [Tatlockia sp.]|nr:hypothetical protein [Tatlockia sp.]